MSNEAAPCDGGCWYCSRTDGEMFFSGEFDTWVHVECVKAAVAKDPGDREARLILGDIP